jgi:nucleolar protein 56
MDTVLRQMDIDDPSARVDKDTEMGDVAPRVVQKQDKQKKDKKEKKEKKEKKDKKSKSVGEDVAETKKRKHVEVNGDAATNGKKKKKKEKKKSTVE